MAVLTPADVRLMWRAAYRPGAGKDEIKASGLPTYEQRTAIFQAIEDWYETLTQAEKDLMVEVQQRGPSVARLQLQALRDVLRSLRSDYEAILDTFTEADPLKPLRIEVRSAVATAQAIVDAETPTITRNAWWQTVKDVVDPLLDTANGGNVRMTASREYTYAWMEVRLGNA